MNHLIRFFIAVCLFFLCIAVHGQTDDCQLLFKKAIDRTKSLRLLNNSNGFEMSCRIAITSTRGEVQTQNMTVIALGEKYKYSTGKYDMFQDSKSLVVIQHDQKAVFITNPLPKALRANQMQDMMKLQDSLVRYMQISQCEREFGTVVPGEGFLKMVFVPGVKLSNAGIRSVTYWIDVVNDEIKKISIDYNESGAYKIKRYDMFITRMQVHSKNKPFDGDAIAMALKNDRLRSDLKGYHVIDKRSSVR